MSIYCDLTPKVNSVPSLDKMVEFKPYFVITAGSTSFDAYIKVNQCYSVESGQIGKPDEGSCVSNSEHEYTIYLTKDPSCEGPDNHVVSHSIPYRQDATGELIYIYVVDNSDPATAKVKGGSNSTAGVKKDV